MTASTTRMSTRTTRWRRVRTFRTLSRTRGSTGDSVLATMHSTQRLTRRSWSHPRAHAC